MRRYLLFLTGFVIMGMALFFGAMTQLDGQAAKADTDALLPYKDKSAIALGNTIYRQNCAACHGVNLEGQSGWRDTLKEGIRLAPPHDETGHSWHHSDQQLFAITKYGLEALLGQPYPNAMPVYEDILSDQHILAVLAYIKSSWPKPIQDRHDRLNAKMSKQREVM